MEYELIRKKRKTLSIKITRMGKVQVLAPLRYPIEKIELFLQKNQAWIQKHLEKVQKSAPMSELKFQNGELIPLFGQAYSLQLTERKGADIIENTLYLNVSSPSLTLKKFYAVKLKEILNELLPVTAQKIGVQYNGVTVTSAKTRWGSCSGKNALSFSWHLAMCRKTAVEYVVVHELCHVLQKNHSKAFWSLVEKYCPEFRQEKKYLKENAYFMDVL